MKMRWMQVFLYSAALIMATSILAPADIPNIMSYQGILTDGNGTVLNGSYDITSRLYNSESGGTPLWSEDHSAVHVNRGVFNIMLGRNTPLDSVDFNQRLWIGVSVNQGTELVPRVELASVAAAFLAKTVPDGTLTRAKIAPGWTVNSLAGLRDHVVIVGSDGVHVVVSGNTITIKQP